MTGLEVIGLTAVVGGTFNVVLWAVILIGKPWIRRGRAF